MTLARLPASASARPHDRPTVVQLIAVGVDGRPQGCDASLLATTIARATGAELMVVAVQPALPSPVLGKLGRTETKTEALLKDLRGFMAPAARTAIETDRSVPHALARVVSRDHADLLVLGSSRRTPDGRVRVARCTRQLLGEARCALAVAPRGLCSRSQAQLAVIGVGYDGTPEADAALQRAGSLARTAGARLHVRAVLDVRLSYFGPVPTPAARAPRHAGRGRRVAGSGCAPRRARSGRAPDRVAVRAQLPRRARPFRLLRVRRCRLGASGAGATYYYADPDGNNVELQVDCFGDWATSKKQWMQTSEEFKANPIGQFVDPERVAADYADGLSFQEIHAEAISGGYAPEQAPVEIPEMSS